MASADYDNNSLRRVKTDRKDAVKIANYTLDKWTRLRQYLPEDDTRLALKNCYRQYQQAVAVRTMLKNNLISSLDLTFPDANKLFSSPAKSNGAKNGSISLETSGTVSVFQAFPLMPLLKSI